MTTPRCILIPAILGLAAACVDDISSTSGDKLSADEFSSLSGAYNVLVKVGWNIADGTGLLFVLPPGAVFSVDQTRMCDAGGRTRMVISYGMVQNGFDAVGSQKVTECGLVSDDGVAWTFTSHELKWTFSRRLVGVVVSHDATVKGGLAWSGGGKRGGCIVDLAITQRGPTSEPDTLMVRGQACGARVDVNLGWWTSSSAGNRLMSR